MVMASESFTKEYPLNWYCCATTTAGHASFPAAIDSPNVPILSFPLAFTISCLRRERDDKERDNLYLSTDKNKETIIINTNETSHQKETLTLILSSPLVVLLRLSSDLSKMSASPVKIVICHWLLWIESETKRTRGSHFWWAKYKKVECIHIK